MPSYLTIILIQSDCIYILIKSNHLPEPHHSEDQDQADADKYGPVGNRY
jgi:hypothetical protein